MKRLAMVAAALLAGCASTENPTPDPNATDAQMAFARLKLLVGKWNALLPGEAAPPVEPTVETPAEPTPTKPESNPHEQPQPQPPTSPAGGEKPAKPANPEEAAGAEHPLQAAGADHSKQATGAEQPGQQTGAPAAAPAAEPKPPTLHVEYVVTAGGHALQEKLFAGTKEEVVTNYFLEGEGLALVRPDLPGQRPHMRLDAPHSTRDDLRFEWDGTATDVDPKRDPHIHSGRIHFVDADTIECAWVFWADGKESHTTEYTLSRASGGFTPPPK
jgi:hypothetical protein